MLLGLTTGASFDAAGARAGVFFSMSKGRDAGASVSVSPVSCGSVSTASGDVWIVNVRAFELRAISRRSVGRAGLQSLEPVKIQAFETASVGFEFQMCTLVDYKKAIECARRLLILHRVSLDSQDARAVFRFCRVAVPPHAGESSCAMLPRQPWSFRS